MIPRRSEVAAYITDTAPGGGSRLPARSWLRSDAPSLTLDGEWRFRLLPGVPGTPGGRGFLPQGEAPEGMATEEYDDATWDTLPVPSHWVLEGDGA